MELKDLAPLLVKKERTNGDIDPTILSPFLQGGLKQNERRKELEQLVSNHPILSDRNMLFRNHKERYEYGVQKVFYYIQLLQEHNITDPIERTQMYLALGEPLPIDVHRSMFIPTIETQGDEQQREKWLPLANSYKIFGAYAQTELGHGSNVQGLETTATYDVTTQEFIIHSPTLTSRKWWPGGLGKTATHAIVHARLYIENQDRGIQAFLVQLRSLIDHQPLRGIQVGDIGPKVGFNAIDNGYCAFDHVRIPRDQMMMRYAKVLPDGTFIPPKSDKLVYLTMVYVRAHLLVTCSWVLGKATTIATRFSAARIQGRRQDTTRLKEFQVLDYQNQQHTLFTNLATSYALNFAGWELKQLLDTAMTSVTNGDASFQFKLAELHGVSSGLKGWAAEYTSNGVEQLRRACGGHGFMACSNFAHLHAEVVGACTFEGTWDVLVQQHARFLLKILPIIQMNPNGIVSGSSTAFLARIKEYSNSTLRATVQHAEDCKDFTFLRQAFEVRSARILNQLQQEMEACGNDMNACMILITRASIAHVELMLLISFMDGVEKIPNGPTRRAVHHLCALFGLYLMIKNVGEFCEDDYLSSTQVRMIRQQLVSLLPMIRKNAVLLTDAWDFSDFILNSAIGRYDGDMYRELVQRATTEPLNATQVPICYEAYLKPLIHSTL